MLRPLSLGSRLRTECSCVASFAAIFFVRLENHAVFPREGGVTDRPLNRQPTHSTETPSDDARGAREALSLARVLAIELHTAGQRAYVAMTKKTYHVQNHTISVCPTIRFSFPLHETSCARFKNQSI